MPVTTATSSVKTRTRQSGLTASPMSIGSGGRTRETSADKPTASGSASAPPTSASSKLSVSSCRMRRVRAAPSAARRAISRCRPAARASIRFARLAQATTSTSPTAATSSRPAGAIVASRSGLMRTSLVGTTAMRSFPILSGNSSPSRRTRPSNSARTWAVVTPGFMRPLSCNQCCPRRSNRVSPGERPDTR